MNQKGPFSEESDPSRRRIGIKPAAFLAFALFVCAFAYSSLQEVAVMEARNFISAREIVESGKWLIPTLNGQPRIAKPPLPIWITAIPMLIAGSDHSMVANRIPSGLAAVLMAVFVYRFGFLLTRDRNIAVISLLVTATSYIFIYMARQNTWDVYAHSFMACAVYYLFKGLRDSRTRIHAFLAPGLFMALSFMSKGPVAFFALLLPFLIGYGVAYGGKDFITHGRALVLCALVTVALSSIWPALVYLNLPHAAEHVFRDETSSWAGRHTNPFWYYLLKLQNIGGVWLPFLIYGVLRPRLKNSAVLKKEYLMALAWLLATLVLISITPEKKDRYIFPAVFPASLLVAMVYNQVMGASDRAGKVLAAIFLVEIAAVMFIISGALIYFSGITLFPLLKAAVLAGFGFLVLHDFLKGRREHIHYKAVFGLLLCLLLAGPLAQSLFPKPEYEAFLSLRQNEEFKGKDIYSLVDVDPEYIWAMGRKVKFISEKDLNSILPGQTIVLISHGEITTPVVKSEKRIAAISTREKTFDIYLATF